MNDGGVMVDNILKDHPEYFSKKICSSPDGLSRQDLVTYVYLYVFITEETDFTKDENGLAKHVRLHIKQCPLCREKYEELINPTTIT